MKKPEDFDFADRTVQSNPFEFLATLREQAPVYREPITGAYLITRADDLREVAGKPEIFSNQIDPTVFRVCQGLSLAERDPEVAERLREKAWLVPHTLLFNDPPVHGRYRRLVTQALSPKALTELEPFVQAQVNRYIRGLDTEAAVDFLPVFAEKLPLSIILHFLGGTEEDLPKVNRWADQFFSTLMAPATRDEYLKSIDAVSEMLCFIADRFKRVKENPDSSLLSSLIHAHENTTDAALSMEEILSIFQILLVAGHDSTRQTLTNAVRILATRRDLFERLGSDRELIKPFIDEVVRLNPAASVTTRYTLDDAQIGGVRIPKGSMVYMCWVSGNRDATRHSDPDHFVCPRDAADSTHLGFGFGIHYCVGVRLAKMQLTMTLEALLDRYSEIRLAVPEEALEYLPAINLRALMSLPIVCKRRAIDPTTLNSE